MPDFLPPIKVVHIDCTVENLVDSIWLFNNIPWMNHENKSAYLKLDKVSTIYYYEDGIKSVTFNEVGASAIHGFGGNSYAFSFNLDGKEVKPYGEKPLHMGLAEDEVEQQLWDMSMWKLRKLNADKNKILKELLKNE
jgi:hypothetical protein